MEQHLVHIHDIADPKAIKAHCGRASGPSYKVQSLAVMFQQDLPEGLGEAAYELRTLRRTGRPT